MGLTVCPAAIVAAPVEVVWENLVQWERYADWAGVRVEPIEREGRATVGQTVYFTLRVLGHSWHGARIKVEEVSPDSHQFGIHAFFPLALQGKPHVTCSPIDATTCRVQYG